MKLKLRMGRGKYGEPPSLSDCYKYFKYIVRGQPYDPQDFVAREDVSGAHDAGDGAPPPKQNWEPANRNNFQSQGEKRSRKKKDKGDADDYDQWQERPSGDAKMAEAQAVHNLAGKNADFDKGAREPDESSDDEEPEKKEAEPSKKQKKDPADKLPIKDEPKDDYDEKLNAIAKEAAKDHEAVEKLKEELQKAKDDFASARKDDQALNEAKQKVIDALKQELKDAMDLLANRAAAAAPPPPTQTVAATPPPVPEPPAPAPAPQPSGMQTRSQYRSQSEEQFGSTVWNEQGVVANDQLRTTAYAFVIRKYPGATTEQQRDYAFQYAHEAWLTSGKNAKEAAAHLQRQYDKLLAPGPPPKRHV